MAMISTVLRAPQAGRATDLLSYCPTEIGLPTEVAHKISRVTGCVNIRQILGCRKAQLQGVLTQRELSCLFQCLADAGFRVPGYTKQYHKVGSLKREPNQDTVLAGVPYFPKTMLRKNPTKDYPSVVIAPQVIYMPKKATIKAVIGVSEEQYAGGPYLVEYSSPVAISLTQYQFVVAVNPTKSEVVKTYITARTANSASDVAVYAVGQPDQPLPPELDSINGAKIDISAAAEYLDFAPFICNMFTLMNLHVKSDTIAELLRNAGDAEHVEDEAVNAVDEDELDEEGSDQDAEVEVEEEYVEEEEPDEEDGEEEEESDEEESDEEDGEEEEDESDLTSMTYEEMCAKLDEEDDEDGTIEEAVRQVCETLEIDPDTYETWAEVAADIDRYAEEESGDEEETEEEVDEDSDEEEAEEEDSDGESGEEEEEEAEYELSELSDAELKKYLKDLSMDELKELAIGYGVGKMRVRKAKKDVLVNETMKAIREYEG